MSGPREQLVVETFVDLADTLAREYDIGEFLQMLVERCAEVLQVSTGGVLVEGPEGKLRLAAATTENMKELEDLEIQQAEGPCLDAYRQRAQVVCQDLRAVDERWPKIATKALEMGLRAVYALPLRLRDDCIGALNLYRETPGAFRTEDIRLAQAFADVAAIGILQERKVSSAERRAEQLQGALHSRVVIEQANGIIAERHQLSPQQAFDVIRRYARGHNRKLREVCQEIVSGSRDLRP